MVWIPPWWRAGGSEVINGELLTSLHLSVRRSLVQSYFVPPVFPVFFFSPVQCRFSLPPFFSIALFPLSPAWFCYCAPEVSAPDRSCSTSAWSMPGCRTWTSVPAGSTPLCLRLCTLERNSSVKPENGQLLQYTAITISVFLFKPRKIPSQFGSIFFRVQTQ